MRTNFFAQTFSIPPGVRDIPAKIPGHPRFLPSKPKEDKLSREGTSFSAPTSSRGRPPPHRAVSGPKELIFVLFFLFLPDKRVVSKRVVLAHVPRYQKPERGYMRMLPGTKTGTRAHSPKPHFYKTTLCFLSKRAPKRQSFKTQKSCHFDTPFVLIPPWVLSRDTQMGTKTNGYQNA